jgi:peptidoglycan-associated lipoprotein
MAYFSMARYAMVVGGFLFVIGGCAPTTASKPDSTPPSASSVSPSGGSQSGGEGQRSAGREVTTAPGSLDALRQGQSSATPASSPLKDIYFEFDRYDLNNEARNTLRANGAWLKNNPGARVEIEGHCDERGTSEYNLALGAKRAQSAREFLVTLGISQERLSTISYGEEIPVCKEPVEGCWQQNRRARFVIIPSRPAS